METVERKTKLKWYVLRVASNKERSIGEKLKKESEVGDLMGKLTNVIVPIENTFVLKNGKKIIKEKVKFASYIFIETAAVAELKYFLKGMNGISGFLTNRTGDILPLTQAEVDRMIGDYEESKKVNEEDINTYIPGEEVSILDGPFSSFNGKIESAKGDKVKVEVSVFGRVSLIELSVTQIDKVK